MLVVISSVVPSPQAEFCLVPEKLSFWFSTIQLGEVQED